MVYFMEDDLRALYRTYVDQKCKGDEDLFVEEAFKCLGQNETLAYDEAYRGLEESYSDYETEDIMPPAEYIVGTRYIIMEDFARDLLITILSGGTLELLLGLSTTPVSLIIQLFIFVIRVGKYCKCLTPEKQDFCRFLATQRYTFGDRLRYMFSGGGMGFLLDDSIDEYCAMIRQKGDSANPERQKQIIEEYAKQMIADGILIPTQNPDRYIIHF